MVCFVGETASFRFIITAIARAACLVLVPKMEIRTKLKKSLSFRVISQPVQNHPLCITYKVLCRILSTL